MPRFREDFAVIATELPFGDHQSTETRISYLWKSFKVTSGICGFR
jgi:hypothetical protein